jgi:hypothetical protein
MRRLGIPFLRSSAWSVADARLGWNTGPATLVALEVKD